MSIEPYDVASYRSGYKDFIDAGYGEYKSVTHYLLEPEIIGYLKSKARAKQQVILMLQREYDELLKEIEIETTKFNSSKG